MNIQHSSRTDNWGTPREIISLSKNVLGNIDLDPSSSADHNQIVGADRFIDFREDGLVSDWANDSPVSVFCNPPGGKIGNKSVTKMFWQRLIEYRDSDLISHAIFLCFSVEALQSTQLGCDSAIGEFLICVPKRRIKFLDQTGNRNQPSHSNAIVYIPGTVDKSANFMAEFRTVGSLLKGV